MKTVSTLTAAMFAMSAPAFAGNLDPAPVEPAPAAPVVVAAPVSGAWTGASVGAQLGYGNVDAGGGVDGDGVLGGVHAGYDYDFGNYVLGAGIEYDAADIGLSGGAGNLDSVARLKLRGGYDFGRTLFYGTTGAAYAGGDVGGSGADETG